MGQILFVDGKLTIVSDRKSKMERGYREVLSCSVSAPSDGMIEFRLKVAEGEYANLWMTCDRARIFCNMLHNFLLDHEKFGEQNVYYVEKNEKNQELLDQLHKAVGIPN